MRITTANKEIDVFDTDIFLVSYPRSGSTWIRWLLTVCIKGYRGIENPDIVHSAIPDIYRVSNEYLLTLTHPRIIKSHEKYNPGYPRVIYAYRDVRDVIVSLFFYFKKYGYFDNFEIYFKEFRQGTLFQELGYAGWDENVVGWLEHSDHIAVVKYEDLLTDVRSVLRKTLEQIPVKYSKDLIDHAADYCTFKRMQEFDIKQDIEGRPDLMTSDAIPSIPFIRSGTTGQWKGFFNAAQIDTIKTQYGDLLIRFGYEANHDW